MPPLIIGTSYCWFTQKAVVALPTAEVVYLDERDDQEQIHMLLRAETGQSTMPYIYADDGRFIGGSSDLDQMK